MHKGEKFKYVILPEKGLIIDSCIGDISFYDIIKFQIHQSKDKNWNRDYNVLTDLRQAYMRIEDINIQTLSKFPLDLINKNTQRKSVHLTNNPNHIVFHTLLNLLKIGDVAVDLKAFSTIDAALLWLDIDLGEKDYINSILIQLLKNRKLIGE